MAKSNNKNGKFVETLKHKDKRTNIPTEELRDFVADDEKTPKKVLYPRDPSLDPQLVWKGKDEQDASPLEVPSVPIYIQEKIHPQALIEDLRRNADGTGQPQMQMFSDFNGISFENQIDFYHHEQNWSNRMILGDSLLVMTSLAEKEGLKGKVQMIYFDPPYGIKFGSNWQVSTRKRDVKDGKLEDVNREPEVVKAFRDTWDQGIHSYLAYLRDRLRVAHELLTTSGSVFVQIGDENAHLVRNLLDEIFGAQNFCSQINFRSMQPLSSDGLDNVYDYVLWYAKDVTQRKFRPLYTVKPLTESGEYRYIDDLTSERGFRLLKQEEEAKAYADPQTYPIFRRSDLVSSGYTPSCIYEIELDGRKFTPRGGKSWRTHANGMQQLMKLNRVFRIGESLYYKLYYRDFPFVRDTNTWNDTMGGFAETKIYVVQTNPKIIARCASMTTDPGDLVLDPTCGSGTTAFVAEQLGRRWITIETSRVALALARTRLMVSRFPYYVLADSPEGLQKEAELTGTISAATKTEGDVRRGFVCKRVSHITLKSIANNEEIDAIDKKWQNKLNPLRASLNKLLSEKWEEWQVPRNPDKEWPAKAKELHAEWWKLRRERQQEIDASIQRLADTELLYDQPYEDSKRIRVTGPFTVESLSPHRIIAPEEEQPTSQAKAQTENTTNFVQRIIDNLAKAGVQNTVKRERLKFERLEPFAGTWLQAAGEYMESGKTKKVAVCIGPEYGTVDRDLMKEAAKEAVQGVGFDLLLICGFAFDPAVAEETTRYGKLTVLVTRMNPDLLMGNELLKKTGAGNLFMVFGEPDLSIKTLKDGNVVVEIKGVDVYDPTTGQIRNSSTDDIACWFIDTDYNGESFFVRHAYFTGADQPYEKLKKVLRAEVDESAWSSLYSTVSRPFPAPNGKNGKPGKIAVKVINHYGDEVLKVYPYHHDKKQNGERKAMKVGR